MILNAIKPSACQKIETSYSADMKTNQLAWLALVIVLCIIFGSSPKATAQTSQYATLCSTNSASLNYSVQTSQIVSLAGYDWNDRPTVTGNLSDGTLINLNPYFSQNGNFVVASQIPQTFTGLTNITVNGFGSPSWATFQITTPASANVVSNYVPADAIVIPASATGNVQIILESSTDLVNWTAASPGTYGASSATNRFFRVRAVHN
jgi:hypothetical protein